MGGNNIDADGIAVLVAALRGNTTLKTLELGYNPIEEKGAEELSAAIKYDLPVRNVSVRPIVTAPAVITTELQGCHTFCCSMGRPSSRFGRH